MGKMSTAISIRKDTDINSPDLHVLLAGHLKQQNYNLPNSLGYLWRYVGYFQCPFCLCFSPLFINSFTGAANRACHHCGIYWSLQPGIILSPEQFLETTAAISNFHPAPLECIEVTDFDTLVSEKPNGIPPRGDIFGLRSNAGYDTGHQLELIYSKSTLYRTHRPRKAISLEEKLRLYMSLQLAEDPLFRVATCPCCGSNILQVFEGREGEDPMEPLYGIGNLDGPALCPYCFHSFDSASVNWKDWETVALVRAWKLLQANNYFRTMEAGYSGSYIIPASFNPADKDQVREDSKYLKGSRHNKRHGSMVR